MCRCPSRAHALSCNKSLTLLDRRYGVTCAPLPGTKSDPYGVRQFYGYKRRLPVEFVNPAKDRLNLDVACFKYKLHADDTVAAVVDAFDVMTIEDFVLEQRRRQQQVSSTPIAGSPWSYENVTYKLGENFDVEVLDKMLRVADDIFKVKNQAPYQPNIQCWHYDAMGVARNTTCDSRTGASTCLRYGNGTVGCALHYANIAVPEALTGSGRNTVVVCNVTRPFFESPRDSQVSSTLASRCSDNSVLVVQDQGVGDARTAQSYGPHSLHPLVYYHVYVHACKRV